MILFDHVVFILTGTVVDVGAEFVGDGPGMAVGGDLLGLDLGDRPGRAEECLGRGHVAGFTEIDIDEVAVAVDRPVEIAPLASDFDIGLVDVPAPARRLRRPSANIGANLASQSRTAS
jgi:hypothetical protein